MARPEVTGKKPVNTNPARKKTASSSAPSQLLAFSIRQFCALHGISLDFYFKLARRGLGPRVMWVGARTLISVEAAADWRAERECAALPGAEPPAPINPAPPGGRGRPRQAGLGRPRSAEAATRKARAEAVATP
jgi:hypothetical protein